MRKYSSSSLVSRSLRAAFLRISLVAICAGAVSYFVNHHSIDKSIREQLLLSTEQTIQRESLPFKEIKDLQKNFLAEFRKARTDPILTQKLVEDFDSIFYRHDDGSYTQRPGLFEGQPLPDGRQFPLMSATYSPQFIPNDDVKARFTLSYILSYKYGSSQKGRLFNFYGVIPEKGFPIYQDADVGKAFTYSGPDALELDDYEFYSRGFGSASNETIFTRMYFDSSNNAWMTTIATPDKANAEGKHEILACVDMLLIDLMKRTARPMIRGSYSTIFQLDDPGTLIFHPEYTEEIKDSKGQASITSLNLGQIPPVLEASRSLSPGQVILVETSDEFIALGIIPDTPWVLSVHYPHWLTLPSILQNLLIVIALGVVTLLVEIIIIRSILLKKVASPLRNLAKVMHEMGSSNKHIESSLLPIQADDEIGDLAKEFAGMAERVHDTHQTLESRVRERTNELEAAYLKLQAISTTDELTGLANRRLFDKILDREYGHAQRENSHLSLLMIDVDYFKKYNDHYGHLAGDACLKRVAEVLASQSQRASDLVARYGGEEFVVISPTTDMEQALLFAQALTKRVVAAKLAHCKSPFGYVTISVGVATLEAKQSVSKEDLLLEADQALYRAKQSGRNRVAAVNPVT